MTTVLSAPQTAAPAAGAPHSSPDDEVRLLSSENEELRALLALQGDLGRDATPHEILQEVVGQIRAALGCDRCYALLWDGARQRFTPAAVAGLDDRAVAALKQLELSRGEIPALDRALRRAAAREPGDTAQLVAVEDAAAGPLFPPGVADALGLGALLVLPIRGLGREPLGVMLFDFDHAPGAPSPLTPARRRLAGAVVGQLTLLLENATLYAQLRRRTRRLEDLTEIGIGLAAHASSEPAAVFTHLYPYVAEVVDGGQPVLALLDERRTTATIWGARPDQPFAPSVGVPLGDDLLSATLRGGRQAMRATPEAIGPAGALPPGLEGATARPGAAICLPLRLRRRTFGALAVLGPRPGAFTAEQTEYLTTIAAQAAVTLEHGRLYGVLQAKGEVRRRLLDKTLQAQESERKHLVDGLLDGALQELASCTYRLDLCSRLLELGKHDRCREELGLARAQLADRIRELREVAVGLRPSALDNLGLQSVLRDELAAFGARHGLTTEFHATFKDRLAGPVETRAYRIAQELLANVRRHAAATTVAVELHTRGDTVILSVADDGRGFDTGLTLAESRGMGLHAIREQAELLGGAVRVQSRPGFGTRVDVILPRHAPGNGEGGA